MPDLADRAAEVEARERASEVGALLRDPPAWMDAAHLHELRLAWIERCSGAVVALASDFQDGHEVPTHRHGRAQLLYPLAGVVTVATSQGRWMVPPEHALWIPARMPH